MPKTVSPRPFAVALRRVRSHLDMGQDEFARRLITSRRSIVRWERGECEPMPQDRDTIMRRLGDLPPYLLGPLAQALGVTPPSAPAGTGETKRPAAGNEETKRALDAHLYVLAEQADVSARKLREAIVGVLEKASALGLTIDGARALLAASVSK